MYGTKLHRAIEEAVRHHMTLFSAVTLTNLALIKFKAGFYIPLSAFFPRFIVYYGTVRASGVETAVTACYIIACLCVALFVHCVIFSYFERYWLLCGAALALIDAAFGVFIAIRYDNINNIFELAFNFWIIIALSSGYAFLVYYDKKRGENLPAGDFNSEEAGKVGDNHQTEEVLSDGCESENI